MSKVISLRRPDAAVGDLWKLETGFEVDAFELYGRPHAVSNAMAEIDVIRLAQGVHLDLKVKCQVETLCDRTLEPVQLQLEFGDSELISGLANSEMCVSGWELDLTCYTRMALLTEIPMQVFTSDSDALLQKREADRVDSRWQGLEGLFASGF